VKVRNQTQETVNVNERAIVKWALLLLRPRGREIDLEIDAHHGEVAGDPCSRSWLVWKVGRCFETRAPFRAVDWMPGSSCMFQMSDFVASSR
jgi:hypothetical protein